MKKYVILSSASFMVMVGCILLYTLTAYTPHNYFKGGIMESPIPVPELDSLFFEKPTGKVDILYYGNNTGYLFHFKKITLSVSHFYPTMDQPDSWEYFCIDTLMRKTYFKSGDVLLNDLKITEQRLRAMCLIAENDSNNRRYIINEHRLLNK